MVVISDETYDKLILDDDLQHVSIAALNPELPVVTVNGLSKSYLVPGFRLGWGIVSGEGNLVNDYIETIYKLLRIRLSANHAEQYAVKPALEGDQTHLIEVRAKLKRRRDITVDRLNSITGMSCTKPSGAFYAFPKVDIDERDDAFVRELIRETGVVVVPGNSFGERPNTHHFRLVFLPKEDILNAAFDRIEEFMDGYRQRRAR
ncbi:aminotransferase class I/II-fold pyridoxal phosphate-dependent enzyme [Candidatus Hydrogenedentota bacterium]